VALFSELGHLPKRAEADEFFATLPQAYQEMMELYFFGSSLDVARPASTEVERERAAVG
jgi:hypothetical protein